MLQVGILHVGVLKVGTYHAGVFERRGVLLITSDQFVSTRTRRCKLLPNPREKNTAREFIILEII